MALWEKVQSILATDPLKRRDKNREQLDFILRGLLFDSEGRAMTPSFTKKNGTRLYRYYVSTRAIREGYGKSKLPSVAAEQIETLVIAHIRQMLVAPEITYRTHKLASAKDETITLNEVQAALAEFNDLWDQLFPVEKNRIVQLLIERVEISSNDAKITCHSNGLVALCHEIQSYRTAA